MPTSFHHHSAHGIDPVGHTISSFSQYDPWMENGEYTRIHSTAEWSISGTLSLPDTVVDSPTMDIFKNRLDDYWKNLPMKFNSDYAREEEEED